MTEFILVCAAQPTHEADSHLRCSVASGGLGKSLLVLPEFRGKAGARGLCATLAHDMKREVITVSANRSVALAHDLSKEARKKGVAEEVRADINGLATYVSAVAGLQ